ncbi:g3312 [Coccomyxa elongata]
MIDIGGAAFTGQPFPAGQPLRHCSLLRSDTAAFFAFQNVAKNLYRQGFLWETPGGPRRGIVVDVHVFLVKIGQDYVLVDVGAPGKQYEQILIAGLREAVKDGNLRWVILTHGHIDHVGALEALVKEYPQVQVAFHEAEAPFLTGDADYKDIPADNLNYATSRFDVSSALPASRVLLVRGTNGDVADARGPSGQKPAWPLPRGIITFHHGPGHAPGHVSYLHKPSGSLVAGDVFGNLGNPPKITLPPPVYTPNMTEARLSLVRVAELEFQKAFCAHDRVEGITKKDLQQFTESLNTNQ